MLVPVLVVMGGVGGWCLPDAYLDPNACACQLSICTCSCIACCIFPLMLVVMTRLLMMVVTELMLVVVWVEVAVWLLQVFHSQFSLHPIHSFSTLLIIAQSIAICMLHPIDCLFPTCLLHPNNKSSFPPFPCNPNGVSMCPCG